MAQYYVYILTNYQGTLYTDVTSDLTRRVYEHRRKLVDGFTERYNISKLVHFETTDSIESAIAREKQIKSWRREKKTQLVEAMNPQWRDIADRWYDDSPTPPDPSLRSPKSRSPRQYRSKVADGVTVATAGEADWAGTSTGQGSQLRRQGIKE